MRVGRWACTFELVGVLVVGTASFLVPDAFPDKTVWSHFGQGYGFVPLVLPVLGLLWFRKVEREAAAAERRQQRPAGSTGTTATADRPHPRRVLRWSPGQPPSTNSGVLGQPCSTRSSSSTGISRSVLVW